MSNAWKNYDNWKLSTPYDNDDNIEVFKTDKYEFYSTNEKMIDLFDKEILKYEYHVIDNCYDTREEYLEECAENLAEEFDLSCDESDALINYYDDLESSRQYALESYYDEIIEQRKLKK